jgi:transposase-like protein
MVRPEREPHQDKVEVDETYIGGPEAGLCEGRHVLDQAIVVCAVEVRGKASGRVRLQVVPDVSARSLTGLVRTNVAGGAILVTDGWGGYDPLPKQGYRHRPHTQGDPGRSTQILPRIHRVFGNLKTWLRGTHPGVGRAHLPAYLDEFVFRFNRRRTPMAVFQTLFGLGSQQQPTTYKQLYRVERNG